MVSSVEVEESSVSGVVYSVEMEESSVEVWKVWVYVEGGGGWWMELWRRSSLCEWKNCLGAVGQLVWQQVNIPILEQMDWSAKWKEVWWEV